jgi:outer membrane protein OmpA-like peptidoglycan-associated protein
MNIRTIALAGAAALLLAVPAAANDTQGWYIGLGVGYDHMNPVEAVTVTTIHAEIGQRDSFVVAASGGYKWDNGLRLEFEGAESWHYHHDDTPAFIGTLSGSSDLTSGMVNLVYDYNLCDDVSLSVGGGVGIGSLNIHDRDSVNPALWLIHRSNAGFMWQAIGGVNYQIDPHAELFLDYRYRSAQIDGRYPSDFLNVAPVRISQADEHVAMLGVRWYFEHAEPPLPEPAAPPPPPPPPPPAPPPPVKIIVVFFDFDKANLTAEAQEHVSEAVKEVKANGFVKVVVTGHTDTVGSDSYNQALSVRRAQAVKDEMVREGVDGGAISIEGKSFHDPLVSTGRGVREPQNRRAVIDLGG